MDPERLARQQIALRVHHSAGGHGGRSKDAPGQREALRGGSTRLLGFD